MEWKKLRRKIQVPAYIQFFISIVFWIAAGLGLYGTLPLAVYVFMGMLLVCNISIILSTFLLDKFYIVNLQENFKNLEHLNLKLRAQRHEYLNEMQVVYGLLELEEYEEAYRYLHPLYEDIARIGKALRTKKPAVNALLQAKMEYAQKQQITFFCGSVVRSGGTFHGAVGSVPDSWQFNRQCVYGGVRHGRREKGTSVYSGK